jgi:hypothetical protein
MKGALASKSHRTPLGKRTSVGQAAWFGARRLGAQWLNPVLAGLRAEASPEGSAKASPVLRPAGAAQASAERRSKAAVGERAAATAARGTPALQWLPHPAEVGGSPLADADAERDCESLRAASPVNAAAVAAEEAGNAEEEEVAPAQLWTEGEEGSALVVGLEAAQGGGEAVTVAAVEGAQEAAEGAQGGEASGAARPEDEEASTPQRPDGEAEAVEPPPVPNAPHGGGECGDAAVGEGRPEPADGQGTAEPPLAACCEPAEPPLAPAADAPEPPSLAPCVEAPPHAAAPQAASLGDGCAATAEAPSTESGCCGAAPDSGAPLATPASEPHHPRDAHPSPAPPPQPQPAAAASASAAAAAPSAAAPAPGLPPAAKGGLRLKSAVFRKGPGHDMGRPVAAGEAPTAASDPAGAAPTPTPSAEPAAEPARTTRVLSSGRLQVRTSTAWPARGPPPTPPPQPCLRPPLHSSSRRCAHHDRLRLAPHQLVLPTARLTTRTPAAGPAHRTWRRPSTAPARTPPWTWQERPSRAPWPPP